MSAEPERDPQRRPEDPGDGRAWVWLGGDPTPHWELRGTGVILRSAD